MIWIRAEEFNPADRCHDFHAIWALEHYRVSHSKSLIVDRHEAGNEHKTSTLNEKRVGNGEESSRHCGP